MSRQGRRVVVMGCLGLVTGCAELTSATNTVIFARHPAASPDGKSIAFTWHGDVWTAAADGGPAARLTVHPGDDEHPRFSPDGALIAFTSDRYGSPDVFLMDRDGGDVRRLTYLDSADAVTGFTPDGRYVVFESRRDGQLRRDPKMYRVAVEGGTPTALSEGMGGEGVVSPGGTKLIFARGAAAWWRKDYRGSGAPDLWLVDLPGQTFTRLTQFNGMDGQPSWAGDDGVCFLSDRDGTVNVWRLSLADPSKPEQLTKFADDDVRDLHVSADGTTAVFARWDRLYRMKLSGGEPTPIDLTAPADTHENAETFRAMTSGASEIAAAPDGKQVALVVRGEVFVISTDENRPTRRVTQSTAREREIAWSPDSKTLYFVSDEHGQEDVFKTTSAEFAEDEADDKKAEPAEQTDAEPAAEPTTSEADDDGASETGAADKSKPKERKHKPLCDSRRFDIVRLTETDVPESDPKASPDGKRLAYVRERGDLIIRDLGDGSERALLTGWATPAYAWSPDSRWIAYARSDDEFNSDVWIIPADGGDAVNVTQHPDNDDSPQWSADGKALSFTSRRADDQIDIWFCFLDKHLHDASRFEQDEYFKKAAEKVKKKTPSDKDKPAKKPAKSDQPTASTAPAAETQPAKDEAAAALKVEIDFDDIHQRLRRVTNMPGDQASYAMAPDGATYYYNANVDGKTDLYSIKWSGADLKRLTTSGADAAQLHFLPDGSKLFFRQGGGPRSMKTGGGGVTRHAFNARFYVDQDAERRQKFLEVSRIMGYRFYHPTMKGLDWPALTQKYLALALQTVSTEEFNEVARMFIGELNASHLGVSGPRGERSEPVGMLGCAFDPAYAGPGMRIASILKDSPADRKESKLAVGEVITHVNDEPVGGTVNFHSRLRNQVNQEVFLTVQSAGDPAKTREVIVRPISFGEFTDLSYDAWVARRQEIVKETSGGRLAYAHVRGMSRPSVETFERDLYAVAHGKDGLIIDVRNNGGGWTCDLMLAILNVRPHAYTIPRGATNKGYPQDRLMLYSWTKPANLLCNEYSFSNAEIFSHAFKTLQRGTLVGTATNGGVISTGAASLIDGTMVRVPFRGWYLPDGTDMELNGAVPDIVVDYTPADEVAGRDPQLEAAVKDLLSRLPDSRPAGER